MNLEAWHYWVIAAVLLITLEMFTITFFLASFGGAALGAAAVAACGWDFTWQLAAFTVLSIASIAIIRPMFRGIYRRSDNRPTNVGALVGQTGTVVDEIRGDGLPGRVKLGGEEWRSLSVGDVAIQEGTIVEVVHVNGATLSVRLKPHH